MGRITIELLRRRSEHNEGEIHSLEELALHQEKLEKIELIDTLCRNLKILLLQNNAISKIENVSRLKDLEYLNLALNSVEKIENLEGCESLKKLDLTLNFVGELSSLQSLKDLPHLEQIYLVGNPCQDYTGYRDYIVAALPQLKSLDGREISQSERIQACQEREAIEKLILQQQETYFQKKKAEGDECEISHKESVGSVTSENAHADDDDDDFWTRKSGNTPQVRKEMIRQLELQEEQKKPKDTKKVRPVRKLTSDDGKPLNTNEAKLSFSLHDECERSQLVLDLAVPKHMCTTLIDADVQPSHVKVTMKGKVFQLVLPEEVKPDTSYAQRSQTTGHLIITMPKVYEDSKVVWRGGRAADTPRVVDLTKNHTGESDNGHPQKPAQRHSSITFKGRGNVQKLESSTSTRINSTSKTLKKKVLPATATKLNVPVAGPAALNVFNDPPPLI